MSFEVVLYSSKSALYYLIYVKNKKQYSMKFMNYVIFPGMLHMLMDTDLDVTQQEYVRTAQDSGKALVSLINEVLDQAKIESGKIELEAVQFDLRSILDDVLSLFSGKSQEKGVEVINVASPCLWNLLLSPILFLLIDIHCLISKI